MTNTDHASVAAVLTRDAFDAFNAKFRDITSRAQQRFEQRDWYGARRDASERLDLYERSLDEAASRLDRALGPGAREQPIWVKAKPRFAELVAGRYDIDRAETFFNSMTRKMLHTVGISREVEFFYLHPKGEPPSPGGEIYRTYSGPADTASRVKAILDDFPFRSGY